jgi:CBS domain-containing protein
VKVSEIMSHPVITVTPDTGIKAAARLLIERGISALPVVDAKGGTEGIVSEADLLQLETRRDPRTLATPIAPTAGSTPKTVAEVMTRDVVVVTASCQVSQAARIMLEAGVKRIPVVRGRKVVGILSRRDLVKVIARRDEDIKFEILHMFDDLGLGIASGSVNVSEGVAAVDIDDQGVGRRLAESVALTVPGVLEVRFITTGDHHARVPTAAGR